MSDAQTTRSSIRARISSTSSSCQQRRQLEVIAGELQVGFGSGAAVVLCLAEDAPFTAEEVRRPRRKRVRRLALALHPPIGTEISLSTV